MSLRFSEWHQLIENANELSSFFKPGTIINAITPGVPSEKIFKPGVTIGYVSGNPGAQAMTWALTGRYKLMRGKPAYQIVCTYDVPHNPNLTMHFYVPEHYFENPPATPEGFELRQ